MSTITLLPVKGYEGLYEVDSMGNVATITTSVYKEPYPALVEVDY